MLNNDLSCSHVEFLGCAIEQCTFHSSAVKYILQLLALFLIVLSSPMSYEIFGQGYYNGGFPTIRHNEIGNITAHLMSDVCNNVELEPILQPITNERLHHSSANTEDEAHVDIRHRRSGMLECLLIPSHTPIALSYPPPATEDMSKKQKGPAHQRSRAWMFVTPCTFCLWWDGTHCQKRLASNCHQA